MPEKIKALKGVQDILPQECTHWDYIETHARNTFSKYGYGQIRVPIIEESRLFIRTIGEETDIVEKEMYTFVDRGMRKIALRPEATACVVRAYLEHQFDRQGGSAKFFYSGPMFRGEKPQAGRNRQFYQIGVEALGSYSPYLDAEVILLAVHYLNSIGIKDFRLLLNTVGNSTDKTIFSGLLKEYLKTKKNLLCENCNNRYERNVLRILDCKVKSCCRIIQDTPHIDTILSEESRTDFELVKKTLDMLGVSYEVMPYLVRGLDYYTKTVFEITHEKLGAQNTILAGGRYDNLVAELGGSPAGAVGFACGIERLLLAAEAEGVTFPVDRGDSVYAIALGETCFKKLFAIVQNLRKNQMTTFLNFEQKSLKAQFRQADKLGCSFALVFGDNELKNDSIIIKDMHLGSQDLIKIDDIVNELQKRIHEKHR
ncbi:MAG: histidine--tRNA ligase [Candidatus Omnitrophica bacterium]|nr:histidine--tRNA ligase [Candidatus Omnitrophota bacterium]MBU4478911.1 histidine--tRNA ligase [Candidatus Omnitrophota bacterium]MCG2704372.1 histidine--tRNA ligase [Candidatus Omnitrophota bacterium]